MDAKEKLVEILKQAPFEGKVLDEWWWEEKIKRIADHLISSGVTMEGFDRGLDRAQRAILDAPAADVEKISDGYHTFADLYEQRLILSAALAKNNPHAWKSKRHEDGSVPFGGGWFIMGFDTDDGCYTYHYELKDWDLFQCEELDTGKPWDGHTSKDVRRLLSIPAADVAQVRHGRWIDKGEYAVCTECDGRSGTQYDGVEPIPLTTQFCPNCGAKMDGGAD